MLLNSKGSASYGFLSAFLVIFFICFIYAYLSLNKGMNYNNDANNGSHYEETLKSATEKYIDKYYSDLALNNRIIVKMSTLRTYDYITLDNCKGYSIVQNLNGKNKIESFVKCGNYVTDNYQEMYE